MGARRRPRRALAARRPVRATARSRPSASRRSTRSVLYTGTDDGQVQVTRDGGETWTNVTANIPGLPPHTYVSSVLPSRHAAGRVYATFDGHYNDDYKPYVYVSDDYGQTWRSIAAGLPETSGQPDPRASAQPARARPRARARRALLDRRRRDLDARSRRTCRPCRSTTRSSIRATTRWSSARTAAASGSSTTSARSRR